MSDPLLRVVIVLVAVGVVLGGAWLGRGRLRRHVKRTPLRLEEVEGRVLFFTDVACRRCDLMRDRLVALAAGFAEIAFNHEPDLHRAIGVTGVPLLVVRDGSGRIVDRVAGVASVRRIRRALSRPD